MNANQAVEIQEISEWRSPSGPTLNPEQGIIDISDTRIRDLQDLIRYGGDKENELAKIDLTNLLAERRHVQKLERQVNSLELREIAEIIAMSGRKYWPRTLGAALGFAIYIPIHDFTDRNGGAALLSISLLLAMRCATIVAAHRKKHSSGKNI